MIKRMVIIFFTLLSLLSCEVAISGITPGNSGLLSVADKSVDSVTLNWEAATSETISSSELEYIVFYSKTELDMTIEDVITKGTSFSQYKPNIENIEVTGLEENTQYYFYLIVREGVSKKGLYKSTFTTTELSVVDTDNLEAYYKSASGLTGEALKLALNSIIKGHKVFSYDDAWDALIDTDEDPDNPNNFLLIYTGRSLPKTAEYPLWNREHVWAKSHGDFGTANGPGTDLHHLRPADVSVNSTRSNKDFDVGGSEDSEAIGNYTDSDSWEPRDEVKGDIARMIFYMAVRYEGNDSYVDLEVVEGVNTGINKEPEHGNLTVLKQWNLSDPVSDFERHRNDVIYTDWQGNRNPFIDHPEWVDYIW